MFHIKFINNKKVVYSDLIPEVEHFFTTRETVIRSDESNIAQIITSNMNDISNYLKIPKEKLISPNQTHSTNIKIANKNIDSYINTDGLIVDDKDIAIYLNFADCTPIILYDKRNNIGGIIHAGWRGTAGKIVTNAVEIMQTEYFSSLNNIYAIIGPAISICCYCVGENVYNDLSKTINNIMEYSNTIYDKTYVDLKGINKQQLIDIGIPKSNIDVCSYCTSCNNDLFFSYRKENGTTSRHSAVLKLK